MFHISNNDFKILNKYKEFISKVDNILENVPRKDMYYKDYIRSILFNLLESIFKSSYESNKDNLNNYYINIKSGIAMIDFMIDRLYMKKYISERQVYKLGNELVEINKMVTGWINNKI